MGILMPNEVYALTVDNFMEHTSETTSETKVELDYTTTGSELRYMELKDKLLDLGSAYDSLKSLLRFYWTNLRTLEPYQLSVIDNLYKQYEGQVHLLSRFKLAESSDVLTNVTLLSETKCHKGERTYEYHCICIGEDEEGDDKIFLRVNSKPKAPLSDTVVVNLGGDEEVYAGKSLRFCL